MKDLIIQKALEVVRTDFMQYPDFDEELEFTFNDALTVLLSQYIDEVDSSEIYDFVSAFFAEN
jgi:hypothetical protein